MDGPLSFVVFVLVAFTAFAVPTAIAYVLFNLVRKDPPPPADPALRHVRRKIRHHSTAVRERLTTQQRFGRN